MAARVFSSGGRGRGSPGRSCGTAAGLRAQPRDRLGGQTWKNSCGRQAVNGDFLLVFVVGHRTVLVLFLQRGEQLASVDDLRLLPAGREVAFVAGDQIIGARCFSAFQKTVVWFVSGLGHSG